MAAFIGAFVETALVVSELATVGMALGYGAKKGYDFAKSKKESKRRSRKSTSEVEARLVDDSDLSDGNDDHEDDDHEDDGTKEKKSIKVLGVPLYDRESSTENNSRTVKVLGITVFNCKDTTAKGAKDTNSKKNV